MKKGTEVNKENMECTVACGKYSNFCTLKKKKNKKITLFPLRRCFQATVTVLSVYAIITFPSVKYNAIRYLFLFLSLSFSIQDSRIITKTANLKNSRWIINCISELKMVKFEKFLEKVNT